jgi:DNA transformation protein
LAKKAKANPELDALIATAQDLFSGLGDIRVRKMFGGAGVYYDGRMFALLADNEIYLKADRINDPKFNAHDCPPFHYDKGTGEIMTMSYRAMPETACDDADEALAWARLGIEAAARAQR